MTARNLTDIVIIDETEPCPYLPEQVARMPLRMPLSKITPEECDVRLAEGHRRTGEFVYQTNCPNCNACEAIRIDVGQFEFSRSHRRVLKRGDAKFLQQFGPMKVDATRVALFNKHRRLRGLAKRESDIDTEEYAWGFVQSCFDSFEISYWSEERMIALAVCDHGRRSLSAVYTFFDPDLKSDSLGTYSILKQIEFCQTHRLQYLYLGYYVEGSSHMQYKSRFLPHERLIDQRWLRFD